MNSRAARTIMLTTNARRSDFLLSLGGWEGGVLVESAGPAGGRLIVGFAPFSAISPPANIHAARAFSKKEKFYDRDEDAQDNAQDAVCRGAWLCGFNGV